LKPSTGFGNNHIQKSDYLGKRAFFNQNSFKSFYNTNSQNLRMNIQMQPHLNFKKINQKFENLFSDVKSKPLNLNTSKKLKKDNFSTCSELNSLYNESILSANRLSNLNNKSKFICKKDNKGQIQSKMKMNTDLVSYSTVLIPEEKKETGQLKELVLSNSYFGDVPIEIREARKQEIRNLLTNIENTFQYEKNSTITLKNLLKLDTLQILIKSSVYEQLSFQMKIAFFVWYWIKLVDEKWFKKTFESFLPELNIQNIKFISEITKM
jgi:hypothetical protein